MNIGKLRKQAGMSMEDLASKMKVSVSTIRNWEFGKTEPEYGNKILLKMIFSKVILKGGKK